MAIKRWIIRSAVEAGTFVAESDAVKYCEHCNLTPLLQEISVRLTSCEENAVILRMKGPVCWANYQIDDWMFDGALADERRYPFFRRDLIDEIMSDTDGEDDKCLWAYMHMSEDEKSTLNSFLAILAGCRYAELLRDESNKDLSEEELLERMSDEDELFASMSLVSRLEERHLESAADALVYYKERDEYVRRAIDAFMVYTCGWSIPTLLRRHLGEAE